MLTNTEKETIIIFNEADKMAEVFTYNKRWQTHFEKSLGIKPKDSNSHGGKFYDIDKKRMPLPRRPRNLSPKQRKAIADRLSKSRLSR